MPTIFGDHVGINDAKYGDWRLYNREYTRFNVVYLLQFLTPDRLKFINHNEVCWKGMDNPEQEPDDWKSKQCDIEYPCIVLLNGDNPKNLKYRMLDGKHRMVKMKSLGINESWFYVLDHEHIKNILNK